MVKNAALSIRVAPELKKRLEDKADESGITAARYAEKALDFYSGPPKFTFNEIEVVHGAKSGTRIKLNVADGMPLALLTPARAEEIGKQLIEAVQVAKKMAK